MTIGEPFENLLWQTLLALPAQGHRRFSLQAARQRLLDNEQALGQLKPDSWAALEVAERYSVGQATHDELLDARMVLQNKAHDTCYWALTTIPLYAAIPGLDFRWPQRALQLADLLMALTR